MGINFCILQKLTRKYAAFQRFLEANTIVFCKVLKICNKKVVDPILFLLLIRFTILWKSPAQDGDEQLRGGIYVNCHRMDEVTEEV